MKNDIELTKEEQREAIKETFRQRDVDIEVIPVTIVEKELLKETDEIVRVGLYTRVSTDSLEQATSIGRSEWPTMQKSTSIEANISAETSPV